MIYGVGTDIVEISRIKQMKSLSSFAEKILSPSELKMASTFEKEKLATFLAKQFAGKEAISKAFGTGIRKKYQNCNQCRWLKSQINGSGNRKNFKRTIRKYESSIH